MDYKTAKKYVESLIFSSLEPLGKNDIKKMLSEYGDFDLEKIKERFYRGKGSQNIKGTGLGLSIVDEIIANHKGKLKIESEEKEGTSVNFTLKKAP